MAIQNLEKSKPLQYENFIVSFPHEKIMQITLNRPKKLNSINKSMSRDIQAVWDLFDQDENLWVGIITGTGRAFCTGADLQGKHPASNLLSESRELILIDRMERNEQSRRGKQHGRTRSSRSATPIWQKADNRRRQRPLHGRRIRDGRQLRHGPSFRISCLRITRSETRNSPRGRMSAPIDSNYWPTADYGSSPHRQECDGSNIV